MSEQATESLGTALPSAMTWVRDVLIPQYLSIGPAGMFAVTLMRRDLDRATKALAEGDVIEMMKVYKDLTDYKE